MEESRIKSREPWDRQTLWIKCILHPKMDWVHAGAILMRLVDLPTSSKSGTLHELIFVIDVHQSKNC